MQSSQEESDYKVPVTTSPVKVRSRLEPHGEVENDVEHCDFLQLKL